MSEVRTVQKACARIPTPEGNFQLCLYQNDMDDKEHLALMMGELAGQESVLVRVHSECFTGDVIGSMRCDCGEQLKRAMELIADEGAGLILYLRQEGRGIGLLDKLRAYNLQDQGYDTVEANLLLGHQADARDYSVAASMIRDLGIRSIRLLTNNPRKLESLSASGINVRGRISLHSSVNQENASYLATKVARMRHLLELETPPAWLPDEDSGKGDPWNALFPGQPHPSRPFVTVSYAQSLNGAIAAQRGQATQLSNQKSMQMTHHLRAKHDAILVGIETVLADDPQLTVRLAPGDNPQTIVVDSQLRIPLTARLLSQDMPPWIMTTQDANRQSERNLLRAGCRVIRLPATPDDRVDLVAMLTSLRSDGINTLMVEGGARIITTFLRLRRLDRIVVTVAPIIMAGINLLDHTLPSLPPLTAVGSRQLGDDLVWWGDVAWTTA